MVSNDTGAGSVSPPRDVENCRRHVKVCHKTEGNTCHQCPTDGCEKSFVSFEGLEVHLNAHGCSKFAVCPACGMEVQSEEDYFSHNNHLHEETLSLNHAQKVTKSDW